MIKSLKRHLDQFSSFAQLTRVPNTHRHTDRQTDHATCDIYSNRPHLCTVCMRCGLTLYHEQQLMMQIDSRLLMSTANIKCGPGPVNCTT